MGVGERVVDVVVEFGEGEFQAALREGGGHCCCRGHCGRCTGAVSLGVVVVVVVVIWFDST